MKMDKRKAAFRQAISCLPPIRRAQLERLDRPEDIEELRFRAGQPPAAKTAVGERPLPLEAVASAEHLSIPCIVIQTVCGTAS